MTKNRRHFSAEYKFRVALEAAKGQATLSELASKYELHPNQISQWKRQLLESGAELFSRNGSKETQGQNDLCVSARDPGMTHASGVTHA